MSILDAFTAPTPSEPSNNQPVQPTQPQSSGILSAFKAPTVQQPVAPTIATPKAPVVTPQVQPQTPIKFSAAPTPAPEVNQPGTDTTTPAIATKQPTGSILDSFSGSTPSPTPQAPVETPQAPTDDGVKSPYFSAVDKSGNSIGFSDEKDVSGKPYFAYRNPGDTSTTTDYTRRATTFDPRVAKPLDSSLVAENNLQSTKDIRMPSSMSQEIRKELGASYSEDLDHDIALELGGSNNRANLEVIPKADNEGPLATQENSLAKQVIAGKISYWDAQIKDAEQKGLPVPWTAKAKSPTFLDHIKDAVGAVSKDAAGVIDKIKSTIMPEKSQAATTKPDFPNKVISTFPFTGQAKNILSKIPISLSDLSNRQAPSQTEYGKDGQPTGISINSMSTPDDQIHLAHEYFNTIFAHDKIDPQAFNKAWESTKGGSEDGADALQRIDTSDLSNPIFKGKDGTENTNNPFYLATERFSFLGSELGVDGISSIPKSLQPFYKAYLSDYPSDSTTQPTNETTNVNNSPQIAQTSTKSILDNFKGSASIAGIDQPFKPGEHPLNTPDDFKSESDSIDQTNKQYANNFAALQEEGKSVDTTNQASVDAYNAKVQDLQNQGAALQERITRYNTASDNQKNTGSIGDITNSILHRAISTQLTTDGSTLKVGPNAGENVPTDQTFEQQLEKNLLPSAPAGSNAAVKAYYNVPEIIPRQMLRLISGFIPLQDVGDSLIANYSNKPLGQALHVTNNDLANLGITNKTEPQLVGDSIQIATSLVAPESLLSDASGEASLTKIGNNTLSETALNSFKSGATAGATNGVFFGVGKALGSGTKDPADFMQQVITTTLGMAVLGGITSAAIPASRALTKQLVAEYNIPKTFSVDLESARNIFKTGDLSPDEETQFFKAIGLNSDDLEKGTTVKIPFEKVLTMQDKPWFAKLKGVFGIEPSAPEFVAGKTTSLVGDENTDTETPQANPIKPTATQAFSAGATSKLSPDEVKQEITNKVTNFDNLTKDEDFDPKSLYSDPEKGILKPEEATNMVNDIGTDLDRMKPGLSAELSKAVDVNNTTYKDIGAKANELVDGSSNPVIQNKYRGFGSGPKAITSDVQALIRQVVPDDKASIVFDKNLLADKGKLGEVQFPRQLLSDKLKPIISLNEKGGKVPVRVALHEAYHVLKSAMPEDLKASLDAQTKSAMTPKDYAYYKNQGYPTEQEQIDEFQADEYGKSKADEAGYKSPIQKVIDAISDFIKKITDGAKAIYDRIQATPNKQGGFINFGDSYEEGEIKPSSKETEEANTERNKIEDKENKSTPKPTELGSHLSNLQTQKSVLEDTVKNNPARALSKYTNANGELPEVLGGDNGVFKNTGDDITSQLGFKDSEEARLAHQNYKVQQKKLEGLKNEIAETKDKIAQNKLEDADAKRLSNFLDKNARLTDSDIKKQERLDATRKAEEKGAKLIADSEKYRAQLESNIKKSLADSQKQEGIFKGILRDLNPIKYLKPTTKAIAEKWLAHRAMADVLAKEEYSQYPTHTTEGMKTIIAQQDGAKIPWITTAFENMYTEGNRRGLDIAHQDNYMPQVWKETGENIKIIIARRMEAQGVSEADIEGYLNGTQELDEKTAARLKLNPSFSKEKIVPDYRTGISMGLHPKFENPVQLIAYYRQEMEHAIANRDFVKELLQNGDLIKPDLDPDMPKSFVSTTVFGKTYWAPKALGNFLNDYLRDEDNLSWDQKVAKNVATASHIVQNVGLMAGIPGTTIQAFPVSLLYTEIAGYGNLKAIKPWLAANSSTMTSKWIESNWKYIRMMAEDGVPVGNLAQGEWNKESLSSVFKQTKLTNIGDVKSLAYQIWNRGWQTKVYDRMMPMLSTEMYKSVYTQQIKKGVSESAARKLAADSVKTKYVFPATQGKTTREVTRSILYGPVWRQQVMNMLWNAGRGYSTDFKNPAYTSSRKLLMGLLATFAAYQVANKKLTGHFTWENSSGHELDIDIPHADGSHSFVTFFPSFLTVPKAAIGVGTSLAKGDVAGATQQGSKALNPIVQTLIEMATNQDYFGRPIYKPTDNTLQKYAKLAAYGGMSVVPQVITDAINYVDGKDTSLQALTAMTGGITKYQSASSSESDIISKSIDQQTADQTALQQRAQTLYNQMKGSKTARADWDKVNQQDPKLAAAITALAKKDSLTSQERQLKVLNVKNGARAKAIMQIINSLPDKQSKHDFYDNLIQDKIATPDVTAQVTKLLDTTAQ